MTKVIKVGDKVRLTEVGVFVCNMTAETQGFPATAVEDDIAKVIEVTDDGAIAVDFPSLTHKSSDDEDAIRNDGAWLYRAGDTVELVE